MHKKAIFLSGGLALAALLSGCVGTGPNTQQGAVTGGALGAIAGAIIGHNSGDGDALGGALLGGAAGAMAGGAIGNSVDHQNGTIYSDSEPGGQTYQVVQSAPATPPPPQPDMVTPSPAANAVWIPGYWSYNGNSYAWVAGHWEIPPPNAHTYVAAHWENQGTGYFFVPSYWR